MPVVDRVSRRRRRLELGGNGLGSSSPLAQVERGHAPVDADAQRRLHAEELEAARHATRRRTHSSSRSSKSRPIGRLHVARVAEHLGLELGVGAELRVEARARDPARRACVDSSGLGRPRRRLIVGLVLAPADVREQTQGFAGRVLERAVDVLPRACASRRPDRRRRSRRCRARRSRRCVLKVVASVAPNAPEAHRGHLRAVAWRVRAAAAVEQQRSSRRRRAGGSSRCRSPRRPPRSRSASPADRAAPGSRDAFAAACRRGPPRRRARPRSAGRSRATLVYSAGRPSTDAAEPCPCTRCCVRMPGRFAATSARSARGRSRTRCSGITSISTGVSRIDRRLLALARDLDRLDLGLLPARA